jgi:hypothetical protein
MNPIQFYLSILLFLVMPFSAVCQQKSRINISSSVGILVPLAKFGNAYKSSFTVNTSIDYNLKKQFFAQFGASFNAVKYNQQILDNNSTYFFHNTNSSILLAGLNLGKLIFVDKNQKWSISPMLGAGYANIGEPRLIVDASSKIISQQVTRMQGVYGKGCIRIGYKSSSKVLQTIFIDPAYWMANVNVQNSKPQAFSISIGTRIGF